MAAGVSFALDDFGTGYSSLLYLKRLPARTLKIDQGFVRDTLEYPDDLSILEGIVGLAESFQRTVIAEGVETPAHAEMLLCVGCELGQGYAIARPMPAERIADWVTNWRADWLGSMPPPRIDRARMPILRATVELRAWLASMRRYLSDERIEPPPFAPLGDDCVEGLDGHAVETVRSLHASMRDLAEELIEARRRASGADALKRFGEIETQHEEMRALLLRQAMRQSV